ncbi:50S ribosomal protein L18 [Candidatus Pacearchaeota archaeon]|nr:50S ribosomal protein L18 [Candidatus Pacearchaeota archaeon]
MKITKRRRRENKTDYAKRIRLLKSDSPRIVFRKTNKYIISQCVTSENAQDKIEFGAHSKELLNYGWPKELTGSLKSLSAAYLTGLLLGRKIEKNKIKSPIIDFGMIRSLNKTKMYAFVKGILDAGIKIECNEKVLPEEDRISGKHMKKDFSTTFSKIKSEIEKQ